MGAVGAYNAQPFVDHNSDIVLIVVTVFTVFAGFLIAIITLIGDPIMIREGSWRIAEGERDQMRRRLMSHIILFCLYLATIALLFLGAVLDKALSGHSSVKNAVEFMYLFIGITSFLLTFGLPAALLRMQQTRYDAEIERRRRAAGIETN
jgi:hypothetical protein